MFKAQTKALVLKKLFDVLKDLLHDAHLNLSREGLTMQALDQASISMTKLLLRAESFDVYTCDRSQVIGVSIADLCMILKCAGPDDSVTLEVNEQAEKLSIQFDATDGTKSTYSINLLDLDSVALEVPDVDHHVDVTMDSTELQRICRNMSMFGDEVHVSVTTEFITFSSTDEKGSATMELPNGESTTIMAKHPIDIRFATRYLVMFAKAAVINKKMRICMVSEDRPVYFRYEVEDMGYITFLIAGRLDPN